MKKHYIYLLILLNSALLTGCTSLRPAPTTATVNSTRVELLAGQWIQLPKPAQLKFNIAITQILTAEYKIANRSYRYISQVQIEKTPQRLVLLTMAGWGGELFSVDYDGVTIKTNSLPMPNLKMGLQHALTDFILTYADTTLVKQLLQTTEIKFISTPRQRIFMLHNKPVITIDYQGTNPWQDQIILRNLQYNYTIKISYPLVTHITKNYCDSATG